MSLFHLHFLAIFTDFLPYIPASILKMLVHHYLAYIVSREKSAFLFISPYTICLFFSSLAAFNIFLLLLILNSLIMTCLNFVFVMLGVHWVSWIHRLIVFIKFGKISVINYFFKYLSPLYSFRDANYIVFGHLRLSHSSLMLCSFFPVF